ncbi:hydrogenase maturation protease [Rhodococcus sp. NM-2]|uniref:hydrogenase maturation protease n=1 Tax=Rhodococcus TaxID=1827 RepID=UPI0024754704|nr:hydrogenase maturation protease [Rhodococcus opacus]MDH6291034.1 hydrogenase maturation protease [Rhodococcus opacus]
MRSWPSSVDAVVCDPPRPGTVYRLTPDDLGDVRAGTFSTHGIPLDHTIQLGAVLNRLPHRTIVLAVEVADLGGGRGLSPAVDSAVDTAVSTVLSVLAYAERS